MIEAQALTKRYGDKTAVDDLTFTVKPGSVTGFLGPNGAGKSTTMRMMVGLDRPTAGSVTIDGRPYVEHRSPMHAVGALLEAKAVHKSRSAYDHLLALAQTHRIPRSRVDEVIEAVGLTDVARKRAGGFSLGMGQRLGIAVALLGDPSTVILDEPVNGLDPDGVLWIRNMLRSLAAEGRTVFVSSHLMSEMALTANQLVIVGRGRLLADTTVDELIAGASAGSIRVRTPEVSALRSQLLPLGASVTSVERGLLRIAGVTSEQIGDLAAAHRIPIYESTPESVSLEQAYMQLTQDEVEYRDHRTPANTDPQGVAA
jgi:ABC-2 type transport system ATP-binding protein